MAALGEVLRSSEHVKAVGSRHSFNHIADTAGTQIGPAGPKTRRLNEAATTVTVDAGTTYGELAPWLHARGFALHNLASLPHISVVGACATATHGSGLANGCLSTAVVSLQLLTPGGEIVELSEATDAELFRLAAVHLGALGIVTEVTLRVQPTFDVAQTVYENLSFDVLRGDLQEVFGAAYSVSLFTDWQGHRATQVWLKRKLANPTDAAFADTFFGATRQTAKLHPLPNMSAENCTEQLGQPGPWYARLPHFRLDYTPSAGAELQTEYFVPIEQACAAIAAVEPLRDRITPLLLVSELRTIAADNLPMSMAYRRPSLALHFTWKQQTAAVLELLPAIEAAAGTLPCATPLGQAFHHVAGPRALTLSAVQRLRSTHGALRSRRQVPQCLSCGTHRPLSLSAVRA